MALLSKELKSRSVFTGIMLMIGGCILSGDIHIEKHMIALSKLGVVPLAIGNNLITILGRYIPYLKEQYESGEKGKAKLKDITREIALFIVCLEAIMTQSCLLEIPLHLTTTYALSMVIEQIDQKGIGKGMTHLFILQLLKDIGAHCTLLAASFDLTALLQMSVSLLPIACVASLYNLLELRVPINTKTYQTYHINRNISITLPIKNKKLKTQRVQANVIPVRISAAGTMPLMHALGFFMLIGLDASWAIVFGAFLLFCYVAESMHAFNTYELTKNLKQMQLYIQGIRQGKDTKAYLDHVLKRALAIGIPLIVFIGIYPLMFFNYGALKIAQSVPFLICETQNIAREASAYNLDYKVRGGFLNE